MENNNEQLIEQIIKTLAYFDIFDYPLTFLEIKKYLGCKITITDESFLEVLDIVPIIQETSGYYHFLGRSSIVEKRIDRTEISIHKFSKAYVIAGILSKIPTIEYIGVSGSLSMNNAVLSDDIDLFFITSKNTLWLTRLFVTITLYLFGQKRMRNGKHHTDKICPNMFLDKEVLTFSKKQQKLYVAHEIVQLKTLFDRNFIYASFLKQNKWIRNFLPNIQFQTVKIKKKGFYRPSISSFLKPLNTICFILQKVYMIGHKKNETVKKNVAMFHPIDRQKMISDLLDLKTKRYMEMYYQDQWIDTDEARFYFEEKKIRILN